MPDSIEIQPVKVPIRVTVRPPGSKSITNRVLVCAALAKGVSTLNGALDSEDTRVMIEGLRQLGIRIKVQDLGETLIVEGCQGLFPAKQADIFVGNSGTTIRFLTALAALGHGHYRLDGIERMRERPINDLAAALRQLGADVICAGEGKCPPVVVRGKGLRGGEATVRGNISSQFLSGLLMAAPCSQHPVTLRIEGLLVSTPYVAMTLAVMKAFGVKVETSNGYAEIKLPGNARYQCCSYSIEPDASAASYFWAAAAVTEGEVTVKGLSQGSIQGDVAFVECLAKMGCSVSYSANGITVKGDSLRGAQLDMNAISDTVQTLAVVALFADGETRIRNVAHIRHKETDRLAALATELRKLGANVAEHPDGLDIKPDKLSPAEIETYDDHRMAMSFAVAGLVQSGVVIRNPDCTAKTYPRFFQDLEAIYSSG